MLSKITVPLNEKAIAAERQLNKAFFLAAGDICDILVKEKVGPTKYLVNIKSHELFLESQVPLNPGDKIGVAIDQIRPQIILSMLNRDTPLPAIIKEYLALALVKPNAFTDLFKYGPEFIGRGLKGFLFPDAEKSMLLNIQRVIDSLIFSPKTSNNPLFVKDYIFNLGLLLERGLQKSRDMKAIGKSGISQGLKGALLKLSEDMNALLAKGDIGLNEETRQLAAQLAIFADASVKTIETQQVINILRRDYDGAYVLQIPFFFDDGVRTGEIFIEPGIYEGHGESNLTKSRFVMFLSMDALGDMIVEVNAVGRSINCMFKFEDRETESFLNPFLNDLVDSLSSLGYSVDCSTCILEKKMDHIHNEYRNAFFKERDAVNIFA